MDEQKMYNEINYFSAQEITRKLYESGLISIDEYHKITELKCQYFSLLFVDLLPKTLDISPETG